MLKTVCIITSSHGRNDIRMFQKQTISLSKNGYKVYYIVADGKNREDGKNYVIDSLGIKVQNKFDRLFTLSGRLFKVVIKLNADIYQVCDPELINLGIKLKRVGKTVIFDSIEDWEGYYAGMYKGVVAKIASRIIRFVLKHYLSLFDLTLVMSPNIYKRLNIYAPGKVKIVSNYPIVSDAQNKKLNKEDYLHNDNQFIYCGSVYDFSVQEKVVEAMNEINDSSLKYLIVGTTPDYRQKNIEASGAQHVEFVSWVNKQKLVELYKLSVCGVVIFNYTPVCCNKEGQMGSNKIFEYMLEGLPVICTDFDLWRELIIDKYNCGICVNPNNVEEIKSAIEYIVTHKEDAFYMGERGRNAVLNEFNWETQAQKYVSIYDEMTK